MFLYIWVLDFVVYIISIDHHIDAVVGEVLQSSVERIVTAVWFRI